MTTVENSASREKVSAFYDDCLAGRTDFSEINLMDAVLDRVVLSPVCSFERASLNRASFVSASLQGIGMVSACLDGATLTDCNLRRANLSQTSFKDANLTRAKLAGADLCGADLRGACLQQTDLSGAIYDETTRFDVGVNPTDLQMVSKQEEASAALPIEGSVAQAEAIASDEKTSPQPQQETVRKRGWGLRHQIDFSSSAKPKAKPSQPKEIYYRGSRILADDPAPTDSPSVEQETLTYRGQKINK